MGWVTDPGCETGLRTGKGRATYRNDESIWEHARSAESVKMSLRQGVELIYHATFADEEAVGLLEAVKDRVFVEPTIGIICTRLHAISGPSCRRTFSTA